MRILLIEDHYDIAGNIVDFLTGLGFQVDFADDGVVGLDLAVKNTFDVIILDINLPKMDGFTLSKKLREDYQNHTPILMLTARGSLADKSKGFQSGALDYLVKPFALMELKLRLDAIMVKHQLHQGTELKVGDLVLDVKGWEAFRAGQKLLMHKACLQVLQELMRASPNVVTRRDLEYLLWGGQPPESNPLRSHIYELRRTIDKSFDFEMLRTVKGIGYRLIDESFDEG